MRGGEEMPGYRQMNEIRKKIIKASYNAGACHIGSALSCIDIIEYIYAIKRKKDVFIFGKASGVAAYYCYKYPLKKATELLKKYPLPNKNAGVPWSGGSLGMGLSVSCGLALADRSRDVYCLISDGELQEGQTYEAIIFAAHHKLKNLKIYCDYNGIQACDYTKNVIKLDIVVKHLSSIFPIKICKNLKGKGVSFMENKVEWHYKNLTPEIYERAIKELKGTI